MSNAPSVTDITHALRGMDYPATRDDLVKHAKGNKAPDQVLSAIENLPTDEFGTMADVARAYGQEDRSQISGKQHEAATEQARKGGSTTQSN